MTRKPNTKSKASKPLKMWIARHEKFPSIIGNRIHGTKEEAKSFWEERPEMVVERVAITRIERKRSVKP